MWNSLAHVYLLSPFIPDMQIVKYHHHDATRRQKIVDELVHALEVVVEVTITCHKQRHIIIIVILMKEI